MGAARARATNDKNVMVEVSVRVCESHRFPVFVRLSAGCARLVCVPGGRVHTAAQGRL